MAGPLDKLRDNMLLFGRVVDPNMFTQPTPAFHREIASLLHDRTKKLINIQAPRGSAKTSIIGGIYPLHHIMFDEGPKTILIASKTQGHAQKILRSICDILDYSIPFRQIFGYWGQHSARKWTNTEVVLKDGTYIGCKGTGQQVRGLKFGNQRPTLIIVDDPEDENNTKTKEAMDNNLIWMLQAVVPSTDAHRGRVVVIGTPLHQKCIVKTLEGASNWESRVYKYINIDEHGNEYSLWEEQKSIKELNAMKDAFEEMGKLSMFYREYQCEIVGDEDQLFKPSDMLTYDGTLDVQEETTYLTITRMNGEYLEQPVKKPVTVFMGVDPASSVKNTADFSVVMCVAMDYQRNRYVLPYFRRRVTPLNLAQNIITEYKKYKPLKTKIETTGYQEMLREYVKMASQEEGIYITGLDVGEKPRQEKSMRLESLQPFFAQHKMYLPENKSGELVDELIMYPRSKHDDCMDGLFYACKNNFPPVDDTVEAVERRSKGLEEFEYFPTLTEEEYADAELDPMLS